MKKLTLIVMSLVFVACGRIPAIHGSSDAAPVIEVLDFKQLPLCDANYEGVVGRVRGEYQDYVCRGNEWTILNYN